MIESISELDSSNVWNIDQFDIPKLWDAEKDDPLFPHMEEKLLNVLRLAFEVVHYNEKDSREKTLYENGEWAIFQHTDPKKGWVAIRKKAIQKLNDLSYENIKHLSAAAILELIDRNFGGGWESVPTNIKDIILSAFDVSNTQLPQSRIHKPGGTVERKIAQGYEVLEVAKGTWVEAIFCKKKEPMLKLRLISEDEYDENGNKVRRHPVSKKARKSIYDDEDEVEEEDIEVDDDEEVFDEESEDIEDDDMDDDDLNEENYYSNYTPEADLEVDGEELDGFSIEDDGL